MWIIKKENLLKPSLVDSFSNCTEYILCMLHCSTYQLLDRHRCFTVFGKSHQEIADALGVGRRTVSQYLSDFKKGER